VSLIPFIDIDFILLHLSMRLSTALELKGINDTLWSGQSLFDTHLDVTMLDKYFIGWRKCKREATTSSFVLMICLDAPSNSSSTVDLGCCFGNLQLLENRSLHWLEIWHSVVLIKPRKFSLYKWVELGPEPKLIGWTILNPLMDHCIIHTSGV
jgi:hypothetical protein